MIKTQGYAAHHSFTSLKPFEFEREDAKPNEVVIDVLYCGVCHSDIHQVKNDWMNTVYPCVPGHEVVGRVSSVGSAVTMHAVGDLVGIGCMIDSCRECDPCLEGEENYCEGPNSWLATYNGPMVPAKKAPDGGNIYGRDNTFGGYSTSLVVPEDFVLKIPAAISPQEAAPILCAGVTTYSPLKYWGIEEGDTVGVVGFGGLGHMAAQIAKAMGADVTIFTTDEDKLTLGQRFGAEVVLSTDKEAMAALKLKFNFILNTIPEPHDMNPYIETLQRDGTMTVVGALGELKPVNNMEAASHRKSVGGSLIGSIEETQEILDFCAEKGIRPEVQMIPIQEINEAFKKINDEEVRFRYVIDMASLQSEASA